MTTLLSSVQFWLGAVLLCCFQVGKFSQIDETDEDLKRWPVVVPNLRARDFLRGRSYLGSLVLFLLVTLVGYLAICLVTPSMLSGWVRVTTDATEASKVDQLVQSVPYPLFIAAAFMGLVHEAIPGFSKIANLQRDVFHDLVGVPRIVVATATSFSNQVLDQAKTDEDRVARLRELSGSVWLDKFGRYGDRSFYESELTRQDEALNNLPAGSERELKMLIRDLVYVAAIATVRKSGGRALVDLARDLRVEKPEPPGTAVRGLVTGTLLSIVGLTILWFSIPMAAPIVDRINGDQNLSYWPNGQYALYQSGVYLLSQVIPVLLATLILMLFFQPPKNESADQSSIGTLLENYSGLLLAIVFIVILFDYLQILSDYGINNVAFNGTTAQFFLSWLPYNILHSIISLAVCLYILRQISRSGFISFEGISITINWLGLVVMAAMLSAFYAEARLYFQFLDPGAIDFILLVVVLNVAAASIAMVVVGSILRRRVAKSDHAEALRKSLAVATANVS